MSELAAILDEAVRAGSLLGESRRNIDLLLAGAASPVAREAVAELAAGGEWQELNDRFFKTLAFGTGGLRGRTIGRVVTRAEQGVGGTQRQARASLRGDRLDEFLQCLAGGARLDRLCGSARGRRPAAEAGFCP